MLVSPKFALFFIWPRTDFASSAWEPPGEGTKKGEVLVCLPGTPDVFVEVKQPGWQGEYMPRRVVERQALSPQARQQRFSRMQREKYIDLEGGAVGSHLIAMDIVRRNALPKLTDRCPNLVVVVDDLKVSPVGMSGLAAFVEREFPTQIMIATIPTIFIIYTYERLGGVLFLQLEGNNDETIDYRVDFVENPGVVRACALPQPEGTALSGMRDESRRRVERRYAGRPSISEILRRKNLGP